MKKTFLTVALTILCVLTQAADIKISSIKELIEYASKSGNKITMTPGVYQLTDYYTIDSMQVRRERKDFQFVTFSGSNNNFVLDGVEIVIDTKLRAALRPPIHTDEFIITGVSNQFSGLTLRCIGNGTSPGGTVLKVAGTANVLRGVTLYVAGSFPYGYGDLFGKGKDAETTIKHRKHSGLLVIGNDTKLYKCKVINRSFGHCFFIQQHPKNVYFEDCYAEGEVRTTESVLAETSGPAFDVKFKTWTMNREGEYIVTPGYMKSLCEDGFRVYGQCDSIYFKNCRAKNTRGGFELRAQGVRLENCTTIGTERAYWVGSDAVVKNCKGDANYGPLMFVEGSNCNIDLILDPAESDRKVHAFITILGENNKVVLKPAAGKTRTQQLPILIGFAPPMHGESMSPIEEAEVKGLVLRNETDMPIKIGQKASNCEISTNAKVQENKGVNVIVKKLKK